MRFRLTGLCASWIATLCFCVGVRAEEATPQAIASQPKPGAVVLWISIDGIRGDFVDRAATPFLHRLMSEGAYSKQLVPVFPSLTFPAHVSQVTGASVSKHGITANAIYDDEHDRRWSYPDIASKILCEPIWATAKRASRRALVFDWPVSQNQTGALAADYWDKKFNTELSDRERLERLLSAWGEHGAEQPLDLAMGYVGAVDKAGHKYGPETAETAKAVEETDALLGEFFTKFQALANEKLAGRPLYLLITTDHGMDDVHTIINLETLLGDQWSPEMRTVTSGSIGNIYLERLGPPPARVPYVEKLLKALEPFRFAKAYAREKLPPEWEYDCPTRTGDIVVSLDAGYMFSEKDGPAERKIVAPDGKIDGPLGMHGYDPATNPKMLGFMAIWRNGNAIGGKDLGRVDTRQMHSTVAKWLEVEPAATALNKPIDLK